MATITAVQDGNWADATIWSGGVVPTVDDDVELNNHIVAVVANQTLNAKSISNANGGHINNFTNTTIINADCNIYNEIFIYRSSAGLFQINGNITAYGSGRLDNRGVNENNYYTINGNILLKNTFSAYSFLEMPYYGGVSNITGNITSESSQIVFGGATGVNTLNIYGNIDIVGGLFSGNFGGTINIYGGYCKVYYLNGTVQQTCKIYIDCNLFVYNTKTYPIYFSALTPTNGLTFGSNCVIRNENQTATFTLQNPSTIAQTYPPENKVLSPTQYGAQMELEGTYLPDYPPESVVMQGYEYADGDMTGNMSIEAQVGCVTPEDVRAGVPLLGMGVNGTCAVPSPDDVREGVPVDDTIGTLIVQGGGDRLRIADFGYYTNSQSDTYIVDITEADKPKFASAEERILIEMFPDLDLNNIPEMYFDDLFVKFLKYRLIVEYYRTAGVNSTFTPSEPTTEIVNYRNVTNEVWLNSANIYLNAWNKKYDSNKPPKKVRL